MIIVGIQKRGITSWVFGPSNELGRVDFSLIVKQHALDKTLTDILNGILRKFLKTSGSAGSRYQSNRINEVRRRIEETIAEKNKFPLLLKEAW